MVFIEIEKPKSKAKSHYKKETPAIARASEKKQFLNNYPDTKASAPPTISKISVVIDA